MEDTCKRGIADETNLPGRLQLKPKAKLFYDKYLVDHDFNNLLFAYARSIAEENARAHVVVTAPTCGSCGIVPACILALKEFDKSLTNQKLVESLMIAGLIGNFAKTNASISGAAVGCQGEVGVACSMAAAAVCYLKGGTINQIEFASEIALEHHLGMTCDPVDGMVQIPCIERNAMSSMFAVNAANYALVTDGIHHISLDRVIEVMNNTGRDLNSKYRETSQGGLAASFDKLTSD